MVRNFFSLRKCFQVAISLMMLAFAPMVNANELNLIEIRVLPQAKVQGDDFTLGEIAELDGFDIEKIQTLSQVKMGRSPLPGETRQVSTTQIKSELNRHLEMKDYKLIMAKNLVVEREGQEMPSSMVEKELRAAIMEMYKDYEQVEIQLKTNIGPIMLPTGEAKLEISRIGESRLIGGPSSWKVQVLVDGQKFKHLMVRAEVNVYGEVVVAKDRIKKGETIAPADLTTITRDISGERVGFNPSNDLAVGKQARRDIGQNEVIKTHLTDEPVLLEKGSPVRIVYQTSTMYITNLGIAMKDGRKGEMIPVRIMDSKKTLYAVVKDSKIVEILL